MILESPQKHVITSTNQNGKVVCGTRELVDGKMITVFLKLNFNDMAKTLFDPIGPIFLV